MNDHCYAALCVHLSLCAVCIDVCMYPHSLSTNLSPTVTTVALLSPLFHHHTCSHSHYSSLTRPIHHLYCVGSCGEVDHLIVVFSHPDSNIMLISEWNHAVIWELWGSWRYRGSPLLLTLTKSRWP